MNFGKITKTALSGLLAATCAVVTFSIPARTVNAAIAINGANFYDAGFRSYVRNFDTNNDGKLSEAERNAVTEMDMSSNTKITSLTGIDKFKNLKKINAANATSIVQVDLSGNPNIEYLDFSYTPLENINVFNCAKLTYLNLFGTSVSEIDILTCPNISYLNVACTNVKTICATYGSPLLNTYRTNYADMETCSGIVIVGRGYKNSNDYISYNLGTSVKKLNPVIPINYETSEYKNSEIYDKLQKADANNDGIISPEENKKVVSFTIFEEDVYELIKNFPYIEYLNYAPYECTTEFFDGANFPFLSTLYIEDADFLKSVDLSSNAKLSNAQFAECPNLTSIEVNGVTSLCWLILEGTGVTTIDISSNPYLVECYENPSYHVVQMTSGVTTEQWYAYDEQFILKVDYGTKIITEKPTIPPFVEPAPDLAPVEPVQPTNPTTPVTPTNPTVPGGNGETTTPTTPVTPTDSSTPVAPSAPETGLAGFIERLYNVALGRASEAQGKNWWINKVKFENYTGSDVANGFLVSDEFLSKQMSNDQFLEVLYKTFFDRASDSQGKAYWLNLMANGYSKQDVINGFCNSTEWANLCLTYGIPSGSSATPTIVITPNEGTNAFVTRLYTTCLGRAPEVAGFEYWTYRLANMQERGSSAAYGFFTSPEFTGKGYDNETYVTLLYRSVLGREPEQAGLNYWLGLMANGMDRVVVLNGFAASTEWADICSGYGILK